MINWIILVNKVYYCYYLKKQIFVLNMGCIGKETRKKRICQSADRGGLWHVRLI